MATGAQGTFLISWSQTELDGLLAGAPSELAIGSTWRWTDQAIQIDNQPDILVLRDAKGLAETRSRAASKLRRFMGDPELLFGRQESPYEEQALFKYGFEITDGHRMHQATLVHVETDGHPMLVFEGTLPNPDQDYWVVSCFLPGAEPRQGISAAGTVCFAPDTAIRTPNGDIAVQDLCEGDRICTKDSGIQTVRWIGHRHITGGRLMALPELRPVRLNAHVLADGVPDQDLILSPDHRVLVKGPVAEALFNTPEVLVSARDMVNDRSVRVDHRCRDITYIHLMLDKHQIVWANGVEVESFHPSAAEIEAISPAQLNTLLDRFPDLRSDAYSYGEFARRNLSRSEAAILSYGAFQAH